MIVEDLDQYPFGGKSALEGVRSVGWIGKGVNFAKGVPPDGGMDKLREILLSGKEADFCFGQSRGFHHCDLCEPCADSDEDTEEVFFHGTEVIFLDDSRMRLGSCEILIPVVDHSISYLASPSLIYHYIRLHQYSPPPLFWDGVFSVSFSQEFSAQEIVDRLSAAQLSAGR